MVTQSPQGAPASDLGIAPGHPRPTRGHSRSPRPAAGPRYGMSPAGRIPEQRRGARRTAGRARRKTLRSPWPAPPSRPRVALAIGDCPRQGRKGAQRAGPARRAHKDRRGHFGGHCACLAAGRGGARAPARTPAPPAGTLAGVPVVLVRVSQPAGSRPYPRGVQDPGALSFPAAWRAWIAPQSASGFVIRISKASWAKCRQREQKCGRGRARGQWRGRTEPLSRASRSGAAAPVRLWTAGPVSVSSGRAAFTGG